MAMTAAGLEAAIKAELLAEFGAPVAGHEEKLDKTAKALGKAIVEYIQGNAEVPAAGTVTSGIAAGDPVTTQGTVV